MNNLQQRIFYIILLENVILSVICVNDVRENVFNDELIALSDIKHTGNDFIHVALIITNVKNKEEILRRIESNLNKMIKSIFKYSFSTHLHFIIITDENTRGLVKTVFKNNIGLVLSSQIVFITGRRKRPKLQIEFVSLESLTEKYRDKINMMKRLFGYHDKEPRVVVSDDQVSRVSNTKYTHDLFFIAPFYHLETPVERLIVLDIDLEFRTDIINLYKLFHNFTDSQIIGLANDLSPHYFGMTKEFRNLNPSSKIGLPGKYQVGSEC